MFTIARRVYGISSFLGQSSYLLLAAKRLFQSSRCFSGLVNALFDCGNQGRSKLSLVQQFRGSEAPGKAGSLRVVHTDIASKHDP